MDLHAEQFADRCFSALEGIAFSDRESILKTLAGSYSAFQLMLKQQGVRAGRGLNIPPTMEEVTAYLKEIEYAIDPQEFHDFYSERGWTLSGGVKMKDWKCTAKRWKRHGWGKIQVPGNSGETVRVTGSLGAMQIQLEKIQDEIRNIIRPGGSAHARSASSVSSEEMRRYTKLCEMRDNLKKRIEGGL